MDLDDPAITEQRIAVLRQKPSLRDIYREWYAAIVADLPSSEQPILEIGSGAGFFKDYADNVITSDILQVKHVDVILDACRGLPFAGSSLSAVSMVNVLHHLPEASRFFDEITRVLEPGGRLLMVEPWKTVWSTFIYRRLHHEPFDDRASAWSFASDGPLSDANGALPWIIFQRDRARFTREHPRLRIRNIRPLMPFSYLASGGFTAPSLVPSRTLSLLRRFERRSGLDRVAGIFASISIESEALG